MEYFQHVSGLFYGIKYIYIYNFKLTGSDMVGVNGLYCFKFKIKQLEANINVGL